MQVLATPLHILQDINGSTSSSAEPLKGLTSADIQDHPAALCEPHLNHPAEAGV